MLYLLTPPSLAAFPSPAVVEAVLASGAVSWLQLRLKNDAEQSIIDTAQWLHPLCQDYNVPLLLNDNPALAARLDLDGAHIGEEDGDLTKARSVLGKNKILGVSSYADLSQATTALHHGADYIAFGAFFPTTTKVPQSRATPALLRQARAAHPGAAIIAIGGITVDNGAQILACGASGLAVTAGVWEYSQGSVAACLRFADIFAKSAL